jgi:hypothetical protein
MAEVPLAGTTERQLKDHQARELAFLANLDLF